ncbi:type IVB secretion system protein IcmH/DotU, partial [Rubrivirga sp.]|uniref:type IVB secretion system protein IcmH/DotU n=1 Tax=Rubrivirga sp. TaxID=1885344 RepID=UPI003C71FC4D
DPDPFRSASASAAPQGSTDDPFAPLPASPPQADPFSTSRSEPSSRSNDWDATPADPYAPAPAPGPALGSDRADPFAQKPSTTTDDPFESYQGAAISSGGGFDSGFHSPQNSGLEVELPKAFGAEETLAGAFTPVFSLILQIRSAQDLGDPTALRQRIEALLSESAQQARRFGATDSDVDEATFCLVAFLDEAILASDWNGRDRWSAQPLQLAHYDRNDAGERFFDRLKALLDSGGRRDVLEVYYLCLALGFKGRYAIQGREVLRRLVDDLYTRLSASNQPGVLSPRGTSREAAAQAEKSGLPTWALWAGAAVLVALIYLVLSLMLSSAANETSDELRTLSAQTG